MKIQPIMMCGAALAAAVATYALADTPAKHAPPPPSKPGATVVELCDGETSVEIDGTLTPEKARAASAQLMRDWRKKNPNVRWDDRVAQAPAGKQGQGGAPIGSQPKTQNDVYGGYTSREQKIWAEETKKFIDLGNQIFHDAKALGGTVSISCDMCHPNGANTHPETYPKFQVQLGRVALLRDMINWCVENPVKGKPFADDDRRLRALEAYILAQRKGVALEYGKH
jgi:thiosulfate dehydrogenase